MDGAKRPKSPRPTADRAAIRVRALTNRDWPTIEALFGSNGACGGCWCMWWRVPRGGKLWEQVKGQANKRAFKRLVTSGEVFGCLAIAGSEPVGWCSVGPRADFPRLERSKALRTIWDQHTWSVTCFFIRTGWRRRGVATALLKGAVAVARRHGARNLEAYPVEASTPGQEMPAAFAWTGVPRLFEMNRFRDVTPPGSTRRLYQRKLR